VETKRLGADAVTLVYRRDEAQMKATKVEREFARQNGVLIRTDASPTKILEKNGRAIGVEFLKTNGQKFTLECDMLFKAIGQILITDGLSKEKEIFEIASGKILVDKNFRTSLKRVYAGGDCINGGKLTVVSVQDGKCAAENIHKDLMNG